MPNRRMTFTVVNNYTLVTLSERKEGAESLRSERAMIKTPKKRTRAPRERKTLPLSSEKTVESLRKTVNKKGTTTKDGPLSHGCG